MILRTWTSHLLPLLLLEHPVSAVSVEEGKLQTWTESPYLLLLSWVCKTHGQQCQALLYSSGRGKFLQKSQMLRDGASQPECDLGEVSAP